MLTDLAATPFAEVLRKASAGRWSGDLQVRLGRAAKTVFFDHGRLVFAASNLRNDRLGETLVALGRITSGELEKASAIMRQRHRRRRFGEALIQAKLLDKKELGHSVARQVRHIVLSLFRFTDGVVSFEERPCPIPVEYMVNLSVHRLLYLGVKSMRSEALVRAGLGNPERRVTLAASAPFPFSVQKCSSEELDMLERCRERVKLRALLEKGEAGSATRLRAAYALCVSGILEDVDKEPGVATQPVVQMETSTFLLSGLQRRPGPSELEAVRQEVSRELASSEQVSQESWLQVAKTAPPEVLGKAIEEKMERYRSLLEAAGDDQSLRADIEVVLGRASALLRRARQSSAAPHRPGAGGLARGTLPSSNRGQDTGNIPVFVFGDSPASGAPAAARGVAEAATVPPTASRPAAGTPRPPDLTIPATDMEIDHEDLLGRLLVEASAQMTISDHAGAVGTYTKIIALQPGVAAHHVQRAIAMAGWPQKAKEAETEFHEALSLDPNNAETHFEFGLYYKAMKQRTRALQEMRTATTLVPRHEGARRELALLSPDDPALSNLRSLLA